MVYKKYITRDGKKFGPYYFKSVRTKDGKVKSVYLGTKNPERKKIPFVTLSIVVALLFVFGFFGMFAYQGFNVAEIIDGTDEIKTSEDLSEESESFDEDAGKLKEVSETEEGVEEPIEKENPIDENIVSDLNESEEPELNITEGEIIIGDNQTEEGDNGSMGFDLNETEINESFENEINVTLTEPSFEDDQIIPTEDFNQTVENEFSESGKNVSLSYYRVTVNEPVRWEKRIELDAVVKELEIEIPKEATNVTITKVRDIEKEKRKQIGQEGEIPGEEVVLEIKEEKMAESNLITGNVARDFSFNDFFKNFFDNLFTGFTILEKEKSEQIFVVNGPLKGVVVEYYMPGPKSVEDQISSKVRQINVTNEYGYRDVLVYTNLSNVPLGGITLYHLEENNRTQIDFIPYDENNDTKIEYIEWVIPKSGKEEKFELEISVLNVQSYPVVGGVWEVRFETIGNADLIVTAFNGTSWSDTENEEGDLEFLNLSCGSNDLDYKWINGSVFVSNYSCNETGYEKSKVLTTGKHTLEFDFGGQKAYAHNLATINSTIAQIYQTGVTQDADTEISIQFNNETIIGSNFSHPSNEVLSFSEAGWYKLSYRCGFLEVGVTSGAREIMTAWLENESGSEIIPSRTYCYLRDTEDDRDRCSLGAVTIVNMAENGNLTLQAAKQQGSSEDADPDESCWMYVERIHRPVAQIYETTDYDHTLDPTTHITQDFGATTYEDGGNFTVDLINNLISVDETGWYKIYYSASSQQTSGTNDNDRSTPATYLYKNDAAELEPSMTYSYHKRADQAAYSTEEGFTMAYLAAGDNISVRRYLIQRQQATAVTQTLSDSWLLMERIGNDNLLFLWDTTGGQTALGGGSYVQGTPMNITWDTQEQVGANYSHNAGESNFAITEDGWFEISYAVGFDAPTSSNRKTSCARLTRNGVAVEPSEQCEYERDSSSIDMNSVAANFVVNNTAGDEYRLQHYVTGDNSADGHLLVADSSWITVMPIQLEPSVSNTVPDIPSVNLSTYGNTNYTTQDLDCSAILSDSDGDAMNVSLDWYNGGVLNFSVNYTSSFANGTQFNASLGSGNTSAGNVWNCSIRAGDGIGFGEWGSSNNLSIRDKGPVGYEYLDGGEVLHFWNTIADYYLNASSGVQITNHYGEYWSHNIFCVGAYNSSGWNEVECNDEAPLLIGETVSDETTYVNISYAKNLTIGEDLTVGVKYQLGENYEMLNVSPYVSHVGGMGDTEEIGILWKIKDIMVNMTQENDLMFIDDTSYPLNQTLNLTYINMTRTLDDNVDLLSYYVIQDELTNKLVKLNWNGSQNYSVRVESDGGQFNAPVSLFVNLGVLSQGQEVSSDMLWKDADPGCGDPVSTSITLTGDITGCTGNGLDIGDNVVLDCDNYMIDGDGVDDGTYGIWIAYNDHNITVKNCIIQQFSNGIFSNGNDNQFINNSIKEVYDFGIYVYLSWNATVVNNSVHTFLGTNDRTGIRLRGANFSKIDNNNLTGANSDGDGITTASSMAPHVTNTNISNNVISEFDYGIVGYADDFTGNNRVENNTIFDADLHGMYFSNVNGTLIYNNDVYSTDASQNTGIGFVGTTTRINVTGNRVSNHSGSSQDGIIISSSTNGGIVVEDNVLYKNFYGIYLDGADWVNVTGNDVRNSTEVGIIVYGSGAHNNRFINNTVSYNFNDGGTEYGYYFRDSDNNTLINNSANYSIGYGFYANNADNTNITNFYSLGPATGNLYFTNSHNASLKNINASGGTYPLYLNTGADNLSVVDSYFDGSYGMLWVNADYTDVTNVVAKGGASQDLRFAGTTADNHVTFLNVSYNDVNWGSDPTYIITRWYLDVKVNDSDGTDLEGANVSAIDVNSASVFDEETNLTGWIPRWNLTEKNVNRTDTYGYLTNYTVNVSHISYGTDVQDVNLTDNTIHVVTFDILNSPPGDPSPLLDSLDGTNTTDQDLNCSDTITDPDANNLNVTIRWYKDNNLHLEFNDDNSGSLYSSGTDYVTLLGNDNTTEGSKWFCSMVLFDGTANSSWGNSSNLTVKNNPNTYYVSKGGNDANDGSSWSDAWLTLEHADDTASANSIIYVDDGRYVENSDTAGYFLLNNNVANRTFISFNKTKAIILAEDDSASRALRLQDNGNNVTVKGFTIDGNNTMVGITFIDGGGWKKFINNTFVNTSTGIIGTANNILVEGNTFNGTILNGVGGGGVTAKNLTVINNTFTGNLTNGALLVDRPAAEVYNVVFKYNTVHNVSADNFGPVYFNKVDASNMTVEHNVFGTPEVPQEDFAVHMRNTTGLTVSNNTFWSGNFSARHAAIWVESGGNNSNLRIINNRMGNSTNYLDLEGGYFFLGYNVSGGLFENNSIYQYNGTGINVRSVRNGQTEDVVIRNNTFQYNYCEYNYGIKVGADSIADGTGDIKNTIIENNSVVLPRLPCNQHSLFTGRTNNTRVRNNYVDGAGYGILSKHDSDYYAYNNIMANQTIFYSFVTRSGHNISFHNNTIYANHWNDTNSPHAFQMKNDDSPERNVTNVTSYDNIFYLYNTSYAYKASEHGTNFSNTNFTSWNNTYWVNKSSQDFANDGTSDYSFQEFRGVFGEDVEYDDSIFSAWDEIPAIDDRYNVTGYTSVLINWTTQESCNSTIEYGTDASLGSESGNGSFVLEHSLNITGLDGYTTYYFNITSCDYEDNCNDTGTFNFTTNNNLPSVPVLITPTTGNTSVINRTTFFDWENSTDGDAGDSLTYRIAVADDEALTSVVFNASADNIGTNYTYSDQLAVDSILYWRIEVTDTKDTVVSTVWNFTISSYVDISLPTSTVDFGSVNVDESDNTTDSSPPPFEIMNGGNVLTDINISATDLFTSSGLGNESYQFRINESEADSYNTTDSLFDWTLMPTGMVTAIFGIDYTGINDTAYCHINITVPASEPVGGTDSNITFTGFMSG